MTTYPRVTGAALDRIEGRAKVRGEARYAYEYEARDAMYAVLVTSTIARGRVVNVEGATLWHANAPRLRSEGDQWKGIARQARKLPRSRPAEVGVRRRPPRP